MILLLSCFFTVIVFRCYNSIAAPGFQKICKIFAIRFKITAIPIGVFCQVKKRASEATFQEMEPAA
jgi:hypothetical protein